MVLALLLLLVMRPLTRGKPCMRNAESKQNENNLKQERRINYEENQQRRDGDLVAILFEYVFMGCMCNTLNR